MPYLVQAWALPGLQLPQPIELKTEPAIAIKPVEIEPPSGGPKFMATLLETIGTQSSMDAAPDLDMRRIGRVLSRLSFGLLTPFQVFSARLLPTGLKEGDDLTEIAFPGSPPGIALFEGKVGFRRDVAIDPAFLAGTVAADAEGAIAWFLSGLFAENSVQQVICHWIGLETLAPEIRGPWRCRSCDADVEECPQCQAATEGPLTVRTVREFLRNELGVDRQEFNRLYDLRCRITHGGLAMDLQGIKAAGEKAARIQELLLVAIKQALGWPPDRPPVIEPRGLTVSGVMGLGLSGKVQGPDFYNRPGVFPS